MGLSKRTLKLDPWTVTVMGATLALFVTALFVKGFTHDLLLEAGVFLISVKLIIMIYRTQIATENLERRIDEIKELLEPRQPPPPKDPTP